MRLFKIASLIIAALLTSGCFFNSARAVEDSATLTRSYEYASIIYHIQVNKDSTFDVKEDQTYDFHGTYHQAERNIPHNKISDVTDVAVYDTDLSHPLLLSTTALDKTDPTSWGRYFVSKKSDQTIINWYYDQTNTSHTWIVTYKVHGGISFWRDHDEIYWNLFTSYTVPIRRVEAEVNIPANSFSVDSENATLYRTTANPLTTTISDNHSVYFETENIVSKESVTIAYGWPKGLISQSAFWLDWLRIYIWYLLSGLAVFGSLVYGLLFWFFKEKFRTGRGTVIPQYEPPEDLRPVEAEALVMEGATSKGWSATVVDLAVRRYVKIEEESKANFWIQYVPLTVFLVISFLSLVSFINFKGLGIWVFLVVPVYAGSVFSLKRGGASGYKVILAKSDYDSDEKLKPYEKNFLAALFAKGETEFSTAKIRLDPIRSREMFAKMQKLQEDLYRTIDLETKAYTVGLEKKKYSILTRVAVLAALFFLPGLFSVLPAPGFFLVVLAVSLAGLWSFIRYNPRLNKQGQIQKEDWLGFKMYLETAEKYRLANLTPETFQKFLPYAMIFGVEKKWGRAFAGINMPLPEWYHGRYANASIPGRGATTFSSVSFSESFSSSFSSAFASSGGSGASGGGGSAGGGGGGGGGGAS